MIGKVPYKYGTQKTFKKILQINYKKRTFTMKEIYTEIEISASRDKIWQTFSDFEKYPDWNPFIRSLQGTPKTGNQLRVEIYPPDAKSMLFKPKVLGYKEKESLRWKGHLIFPGLFDGEHIFELKDQTGGKVLFIQRERFSGILVPLFRSMLENNTRRGFELMNKKLKELCEK